MHATRFSILASWCLILLCFFVWGVFFIYQNEKTRQNKTDIILLLKGIHTSALFSFSADDFIANRRLKLLHFVFNQTSFS